MSSSDLFHALVVLVLVAVASGCASEGHHYLHKEERPHAAQWGYTGATGPEHWGSLTPEYSLAKTGRQQSPIDIADAAPKDLAPIEFHYGSEAIRLIYNGHTIEEKDVQGSSIVAEGKKYKLQQFHFHSPSEHLLDNQHTEMEMHMVHMSDDGDLAVVAVMIEPGAENSAFHPIWDCLPTAESSERTSAAAVDTDALLPEGRSYYRYMGSFTTPPCTEGVLWMVLRDKVSLSREQIEKFRAVIHGNNRPVQPLNGRQITTSG